MEKLRLLYIDDAPDPNLSRYLETVRLEPDFQVQYCDKVFSVGEGYESLIYSETVKLANIIVIDSRLFEHSHTAAGMFTGEEFKVILKKYYPFIEVIVITQNGGDPAIDKISKYDISCGVDAMAFYKSSLFEHIKIAAKNILVYRKLGEKLQGNDSWESILKEKIINSLNGLGTYDELSKSDVDQLIAAFKEIQEKIDV